MARRQKNTEEDPALTEAETPVEETNETLATEGEATAEDGPKKVVICPDKSKYQRARSASGAVSMNCGDPVAQGLQGVDLNDVYTVTANVLDCSIDDLIEKYQHLNGGQQRMNCGNRIRGAFKKLEKAEEGSSATAVDTFLANCANYRTSESQKEFGKPKVQEDAEAQAQAS